MSAVPQGLGDNLLVSTEVTTNHTGAAQQVLLYDKHSYQVINDNTNDDSIAYFVVEATNQNGPDATYLPIADYQINSGSNVNAKGIMYSDDWRFVQCRFAITGHEKGSYTVVENHIY